MKVILLERVERLGALGDTVTVKDGFARNFLLPRSKALRATAANLQVFEAQKAQIVARNDKDRELAEKAGEALDGTSYILVRQAGESGQLYGSVNGRDVADAAVGAHVGGEVPDGVEGGEGVVGREGGLVARAIFRGPPRRQSPSRVVEIADAIETMADFVGDAGAGHQPLRQPPDGGHVGNAPALQPLHQLLVSLLPAYLARYPEAHKLLGDYL